MQRRRSSIATVVEQQQSSAANRRGASPTKFDLPSTSKVANPPTQLVTSKNLPQGIQAATSIASTVYPPAKTGFATPLNKVLILLFGIINFYNLAK